MVEVYVVQRGSLYFAEPEGLTADPAKVAQYDSVRGAMEDVAECGGHGKVLVGVFEDGRLVSTRDVSYAR